MKANDNFDLAVSSPGDTKVISIDDRLSLQRYRESTIKMYTHYILNSAVMPKDASPADKEKLAIAGAILKSEYDIDVVAEEAYFIKTSKGYLLATSYKGMTKARLRIEEYTGKRWIDGPSSYMDQEGIVRLGLDICRKCGGSGRKTYKGEDKGPCYACEGNGKFDPAKVLHYETSIVCVDDALMAKEIGVEYYPVRGSALWQPCDNIPQNRTAQWVVEKNAFKDLLRRVFPITISDGSSFELSNVGQEIEDKSTERIAVLAADYGVEYDDLQSLAGFVRNCVFAADWKDEDEVMSALASLDLDWEISKLDEIKYKVFGYRTGEYPIDETLALDKDEKPNGILVMNVIADVGGRDRANEISQELFQKQCSVTLTRAQLKQIYESVVDGQQS
jgi:hypothetical protein